MATLLVVALLGLGWVPLTNAADKPHVLMLLADDFGWANAGARPPTNTLVVKNKSAISVQ